MKNGGRSDRELVKVLGVSQPTVSRLIKKQEKDGTIKENTMIPDFRRLGINLFVAAFARHAKQLDLKELD
jgi:DNA-binding Lrp family transcriptional regulator